MLNRYRYVACFVAGQLLALPIFNYVGMAFRDGGGGPTAAGIATGLGLGLLAAVWVNVQVRGPASPPPQWVDPE